MPNWASSKIVINGSFDNLKAIKTQLSRPYTTEHGTFEGDFLLWNIVKPDNLALYFGKTDEEILREIERNNPDLADTRSTDERLAELQADIASGKWQKELIEKMNTGMGWYEWNVREWGTKWETNDDHGILSSFVSTPDPLGNLSLVYRVTSAWSPPAEALDKLAKQYPAVSIYLDSIDENDCFAVSGYWSEGERQDVSDVEITHDFHIELQGSCWACDTSWNDELDPDYQEARERLGCPNEEA
jgi:hypothetical protein